MTGVQTCALPILGEAILFSGVVENDGLHIQVGSLRWALQKPMVAGKVQVAIRPQAWKWMGQNQANPAEEYLGIGQQLTSLAAKVCKLAYLGNAYEVTVRTDIGEFWFPCESYGRLPQVGETIQLAVRAHGVNVLADKG